MKTSGGLVPVADTKLYIEQRGEDQAFPVVVLHGGPGLDHHEFGDYLDPIAASERYRLLMVDQRAQGRSDRSAPPKTWTLKRMAADVSDLCDRARSHSVRRARSLVRLVRRASARRRLSLARQWLRSSRAVSRPPAGSRGSTMSSRASSRSSSESKCPSRGRTRRR